MAVLFDDAAVVDQSRSTPRIDQSRCLRVEQQSHTCARSNNAIVRHMFNMTKSKRQHVAAIKVDELKYDSHAGWDKQVEVMKVAEILADCNAKVARKEPVVAFIGQNWDGTDYWYRPVRGFPFPFPSMFPFMSENGFRSIWGDNIPADATLRPYASKFNSYGFDENDIPISQLWVWLEPMVPLLDKPGNAWARQKCMGSAYHWTSVLNTHSIWDKPSTVKPPSVTEANIWCYEMEKGSMVPRKLIKVLEDMKPQGATGASASGVSKEAAALMAQYAESEETESDEEGNRMSSCFDCMLRLCMFRQSFVVLAENAA